MVPVAGGIFGRGCTAGLGSEPGQDLSCGADEAPYHPTQIDDFYGPCLRPDSFRYQNDNGEYKRANVDWEVWSAQGHPFDLYDGIEICEPV